MSSWKPYFAEKAPRQSQQEALDQITESWDRYTDFILEAPTGVGKSAIAFTLSRWLWETKLQKSFITTSSIALQNQYEDSYADQGLMKLYSADNFVCGLRTNLSCGDGRRLPKGCDCDCPYVMAKESFIRNPYGILNLAYYINEANYAGQLGERGLMIFDECHNLPSAISSFFCLEFTQTMASKYLVKIPLFHDNFEKAQVQLLDWVTSELQPKVDNAERKFESMIDGVNEESTKYLMLSKELTAANKLGCRLRRIQKQLTEKEWVVENRRDRIEANPLYPKDYAQECLTGKNQKRLHTSATIDPNFYMDECDLNPDTTLVIRQPSPFPVENRPIYSFPSGKINYKDVRGSLESFREPLLDIIEEHENERGIIFVSSYEQARVLVEMLNLDRVHTHVDSASKDYSLKLHSTQSDSIIVSPSMHEGIDLKGDLSRFQVVLKLPFLSLGSKLVKRRAQLDEDWYNLNTCLTLMQSTGRSVRSNDDHAVTYILDSSWTWFFNRNRKFFPQYWLDAVE